MTAEPGQEPTAAASIGEAAAGGSIEAGPAAPSTETAPSTEVVPTQRRVEFVAPGRWTHLATGLRGRLPELSRRPAAVASVSAATTIGGAMLVTALRHAARAVAARPPAATGSPVIGYVLHEVHVFHHLVHTRDGHGLVTLYTPPR